jgi:hypothetical protein
MIAELMGERERAVALEHGVTLWGAPGAGKSGLLGALYAASLRPDVDGWSAHPKDCEDAYTQERLKDAYLGLRGRTNTKTGLPAAGGDYPPLRAVLRRLRGRRSVEALRVALVDPAGEFSTQLELGTTPEGRTLFGRIARGGGVVWLVEASQRADDVGARMLALQHLVALLEQGGSHQLSIPVALCLSKIDRLPADERAAARADAGSALRAHLGETAFTWFEAVCPRMRCFAISSTGAVDGHVQPEGLDEVFDWLADVTRPRVTWRERVQRIVAAIPPVPPSARSAVGTVLLATGLLGALGATVKLAAPTVSRLASRPAAASPAPRTRAVDAGEVARAALSPADAEERLERARERADRGDWDGALASLTGRVPPAGMRFAWDSLYVVTALRAAADARDASEARRLREAARTRATEMVRRGPAGSRRLAAVRFARAVACVDGDLDCPRADVVADFTWALLGPSPMRREARERLSDLGAGYTP